MEYDFPEPESATKAAKKSSSVSGSARAEAIHANAKNGNEDAAIRSPFSRNGRDLIRVRSIRCETLNAMTPRHISPRPRIHAAEKSPKGVPYLLQTPPKQRHNAPSVKTERTGATHPEKNRLFHRRNGYRRKTTVNKTDRYHPGATMDPSDSPTSLSMRKSKTSPLPIVPRLIPFMQRSEKQPAKPTQYGTKTALIFRNKYVVVSSAISSSRNGRVSEKTLRAKKNPETTKKNSTATYPSRHTVLVPKTCLE